MDEPVRSPAETVLASAQADPVAAAAAARALLDGADDPRERVVARWALGFAERELADLESAEDQMRTAVDDALALGDEVLAARISTSLALVVMNRGAPGEAMQMIERPISVLTGADRARAVMQRGAIRYRLADFDGALADHLDAVDDLRAAQDWIALARLHVNVGSIQSYRRDLDAAAASLDEAIELAELHGQALLAGYAHHNLGHLRALRGDIPAALVSFDAAMRRYEQLGAPADQVATLMADRARTLADAGLHLEAIESVSGAYELVRHGANTAEAADIALLAADICVNGGAIDRAGEPARWARDAYADQGRDGWVPLAELLLVRADVDADLLERARVAAALADELEHAGWTEEAQAALIFAAELFSRGNRTDDAERSLADAIRLDAVTLRSQAARWLAMARQHALSGDLDAARAAVDGGLELLATNRALLRAVELLARSIESGAELARLGVDVELRRDNVVGVLEVLRRAVAVERSSDAAPDSDEQLLGWLTDLRRTVNDLRTLDQASDERLRVRHRQAELEQLVRDRSRRSVGGPRAGRADADEPGVASDRIVVVETLGDATVAIGVTGDHPGLWRATSAEPVAQLVETIEFALHRLNRTGVSAESAAVASAMLDDAAGALDAIIVPPAVRRGERPLVITPTDVLHGLSWRVLPSLRSRSLTVSTTLGDPPPPHDHGRVLLVAGPDLEHADAEIAEIGVAATGSSREATVLLSPEATVERVVAGLSSADLAHIACHGSFRADNPLFSALHLADGDLTIYELEACPELPHTVILSACNAGQSSVLRGGALLGMANALLQMGVASVIAPLSPVNDQRLVPIMRALHARLAAGADPATALAAVSIDGDGQLDPTAAAFVCFGR